MKSQPSSHFHSPPTSLLFVESNIAVKLGLKEAMILQQMHFWLQTGQYAKPKNGWLWVCKTYEQWKDVFPFWSDRTLQRAILNLEEKGILETYLSGGYRTIKHYTINYDVLQMGEIDLLLNRSCGDWPRLADCYKYLCGK